MTELLRRTFVLQRGAALSGVILMALASCGSGGSIDETAKVGGSPRGVCEIAMRIRDVDAGLGPITGSSFESRDAAAVELRYLLGRLRVEARGGDRRFVDAVEGPTLGLEVAPLADVLTVANRASASRLSDGLLEECGFGLSLAGALLRPTTFEGG